MEDHSFEFRRCLEELDVVGVRKIWAYVSPHLEQPKTDAEALLTLHVARTASNSVRFRLRAYSHRWLTDNGYPSQLPDDLKPRAERIYPKIVEGVLISVNFSASGMKPAADFVRGAMEQSVLESYDEKISDTAVIKSRMLDARQVALRKAFGSFYKLPTQKIS